MRLGTTRGTNALLERQGASTAFVTTRGFADCLRIGTQNRPRLFDLNVRKAEMLYREVVEIDERLDAQGVVLAAPDLDAVARQLAPLREAGIVSLAICLLHAPVNPVHEQAVEQVALELGFDCVVRSSELAPFQGLVSRAATTVLDAYLTPIIASYLSSIRQGAPQARLRMMTSAGALVDADQFVGKDSILSGPAGGVVGCAAVARAAGDSHAIGFDMGGTSTDVSRWDGSYERRYEMALRDPRTDAEIRIVAPMLAIETVAAGGGSICDFDGVKPVVGPLSAGADPGPACYGRGGPLTITDVNLVLGRLAIDALPFPLDLDAAHRALDALRARIGRYTRNELAEGYVRIANAKMAAAIRKISIARGYDPRDYTLVSFGGAGSQHACGVAQELGITRILAHPHAGILSAYGIGMADLRRFGGWHVGAPLGTELEQDFLAVEQRLRDELLAEGTPQDRLQPARRLLDLRYAGQDSALTIGRPDDGDWRAAFEAAHRQQYGFAFPQRAVEIVSGRVELTAASERPVEQRAGETIDRQRSAGTYRREDLRSGDRLPGPSIVIEAVATIVVEEGWQAQVSATGDLLLQDMQGVARTDSTGVESDPILLELFNNRFAAIAEQMGETLRKTAISTNVKERLDFSCAIFDPAGELVVNAPHIPVHLGAMGETVRQLIVPRPAMRPGDVYLTNDPYQGGSHLPDVTAITPVFGDTDEPIFFTASRAHHAEIGGITPGSMPPFSRRLEQEGVLIRNLRLVRDDRGAEQSLRELLESGPHPSRSVDENLADIWAQVAANQSGAVQLLALIEAEGLALVQAYMGHIQRAAEQKMREALRKIAPGVYRFADRLDDGAPLVATISIEHGEQPSAVVDFSGTGPVLEGNLNAPRAIVSSAALYCFRCLIGEEIPLNAGVLRPIQIVLPDDCLLNPTPGAAVVGGNVETSQRVVDVIFGALGVVAASQGTMNNLIFGDESFGYYETLCGGAGAGPGFAGAHAVHTHMTNTRLTDPEVLESRYPVRLVSCSVRHGSGGAGQFVGGDGIRRELCFLAPVQLSLLTQRRLTAPYGLAGGSPGQSGRNLLRLAAGETQELAPIVGVELGPGDTLIIETPGGGGYGPPA